MSAITHWAERHLRIPYNQFDTRKYRLRVTIVGLATVATIGLTSSTIVIFLKRPKAPELVMIGAAQQYAAVGTEVEHRSVRRPDAEGAASARIKVQREAQQVQKVESAAQPRNKTSPQVVQSETIKPAPGPTTKSEVVIKPRESNVPTAPVELALPNRPTNIAPAEKFGFRQVGSDAIILMNGSKIALHGRFPNGEALLRIDAAKGIVETDRRIMMIASPTE